MVGLYDNINGFRPLQPIEVFVGLMDDQGNEAESFPIAVINVNGQDIGEAFNKQDYIDIWNADAANVIIGRITGHTGPFGFLLLQNVGQVFTWITGISGLSLRIDEKAIAIEGKTVYVN